MNKYYFTDSATESLEWSGSETVTVDSFDASNAETVTLDSKWNDFFDTNEYIKFTGTVTQPMTLPYIYDGELRRFRKTEGELKQAQAQIDSLPWTIEHPPQKRVTKSDQIRGFWTDPVWNDGQTATLYIPANDPDAARFAIANDGVSPGFTGTIQWADDDTVGYDGDQANLVYDHIASVENPRCPPSEGCNVHADSLDEDIEQVGEVTILDDVETPTENIPPNTADQDGDNTSPATESTDTPAQTDNQQNGTNMTDITELLNDSNVSKDDVLDHYGIEEKESPTDFYDGEPDVEDIADDFPTVQVLLDSKEELAEQVDSLQNELRETKRPQYEQKVEELVQIADDAFGSKEELMDAFDSDDDDARLTVDDIEDKIDKAEKIVGTDNETTTINDDGEEIEEDETPDIARTSRGGFDLREQTK